MALLLLYNLYACVTLRRPPIHGTVVDAETGRPIAGAEVFGAARFTVLAPVETADRQRGGGVFGVTDGRGRFSLPGASCVWWSPAKGADAPVFLGLLIPKWMNEIELRVYGHDFVTENLGAPPSVWVPYFAASEDGPAFHRWRVPFFGYYYRIAMQKAGGEDQWKQKCSGTLRASQYLPEAIGDRWLFNDLTGYLERWPQGEKAGTYFTSLLATGLIESCETLQEDWRKGEVSAADLKLYRERNDEILKLASRVHRVAEPIRAKIEEEEIQAMRDLLPCIDEVLREGRGTDGR